MDRPYPIPSVYFVNFQVATMHENNDRFYGDTNYRNSSYKVLSLLGVILNGQNYCKGQ